MPFFKLPAQAGALASRRARIVLLLVLLLAVALPAAGAARPVVAQTREEARPEGAAPTATPLPPGEDPAQGQTQAEVPQAPESPQAPSAGKYSVFVPAVEKPKCEAHEPNERSPFAGPLSGDATLESYLCEPGDVDFFKFSVVGAGQIEATLSVPSSLVGHVSFWLYDGAGEALVGKSTFNGTSTTLDHSTSGSGDYLLGVYTPEDQADPDDPYALSVSFPTCYTLETSANPAAYGSVTRTPAYNCSDGSSRYAPGTVVSLGAPASTGWHFSGWIGVCKSLTSSCSVTMSANKATTASFSINCYTLSTSVTGGGSIGLSPAPNCGSQYSHGTAVQLTATPNSAAGYQFSSWGGSCSGTSSICGLTMTGSRSASASFTLKTYQLTVSVGGVPCGGFTNPSGTITVQHGVATSISASPTMGAGCKFYFWQINTGGSTAQIAASSSASTTIKIYEPTAITAIWIPG